MVEQQALHFADLLKPLEPTEVPEEILQWSSVKLSEVSKHGLRLEASVFGLEGKFAREVLKQSKYSIVTVTGENGLANAFYPTRFKRILVDFSPYPLILPSQIRDIKPKPKGYLSPLCNTDFESLKAKRGQILLTRSGTIGNCSLVTKTLEGKTLSDDIIRITCKNSYDTGYLYAFLRTKIGNALIRTNEYGAVVSHIEPKHLESVPIPNPQTRVKSAIHEIVLRSYNLREESNDLLNKAENLLIESLKLHPITQLQPSYYDGNIDLRNYINNLSGINGRLDASYHLPILDSITQQLSKGFAELTTIGDPRISKDIILPGHFKRIYVEEGQGTPLIGGKQIYELDPSSKKYLALNRYVDKLKNEILLKQNMVIITAKGTPGKVVLVPRHWDGWLLSSNVMKIIPSSEDIAGYLYVFLSTSYGFELLKRNIYGSVVDIMEPCHIAQVIVPLLKQVDKQNEINRLALEANNKRSKAYYLEQEAIRMINELVIHQK